MPPSRTRRSTRAVTAAETLHHAFTVVAKNASVLKATKNVGSKPTPTEVKKSTMVGVVLGKRVIGGEVAEVVEVVEGGDKTIKKEENSQKVVAVVEDTKAEEKIDVDSAKGKSAPRSKKGKADGTQEQKEEYATETTAVAEAKEEVLAQLEASSRSRKRTRTQQSVESSALPSTTGSAAVANIYTDDVDISSQSTPKTKLKPTPRTSRNAKLLSIAGSDPQQTKLASTTPSTNPLAPNVTLAVPPTNSSSETTISSLNTLITLGSSSSSTPMISPGPEKPPYLCHLTNLHAHLLTSIYLHHAQNGLTSLPAFKSLKPNLEQLSKRTVELVDLRRICWLTAFQSQTESDAQQGEDPPSKKRKGKKKKTAKKATPTPTTTQSGWLKIVDYGNEKIVIELTALGNEIKDVNHLRSEFVKKADLFWKERQGRKDEAFEEMEVPLGEIVVSEVKKMVETVLKAKGQRRLLEMKGVQVIRGKGMMEKSLVKGNEAVKVVENPPAPAVETAEVTEAVEYISTATPSTINTPTPVAKPTPTTQVPAPTATKLSLLDRIRAKHQAALEASGAAPLDPIAAAAAHARLCAQQRLPEVIPILRSLRLRAGGGLGKTGRKSLSLEEVIIGIKQSVRSGISRAEAELCVRLAGEVGADPAKVEAVEGRKNEVEKNAGERKMEKGKGGLLDSFGSGGVAGGFKKAWEQDEKGWVEVVECGGVKAVVFK